jgi:hypothetical protein
MSEIRDKKLKSVPFYKKGFVFRPVPTITSTTLCFIVFGAIFVVIGSILFYLTSLIKELVIRYDNIAECDNALRNSENKTCIVEIKIEEELEPPVMVYYQLENFYQAHRRYIKSKSNDQLKGKNLTTDDISTDCEPILKMKDIGIYKTYVGNPLSSNDTANPCGLIAKSFFNDTYDFFINDRNIPINETDIAWDSDKNNRYVRSYNSSYTQWLDVENEHFMVWMRPAGLPDFRKLWGRINQKLNPGVYRLIIKNNYDVSSFSGKKSFALSTVNALGGKNYFLGIAYIVVGCISIIFGLLFWFGYKNYNSDKKNN